MQTDGSISRGKSGIAEDRSDVTTGKVSRTAIHSSLVGGLISLGTAVASGPEQAISNAMHASAVHTPPNSRAPPKQPHEHRGYGEGALPSASQSGGRAQPPQSRGTSRI